MFRSRPWLMAMRWHDLLFMHWPIPPGKLRPLIPPQLELDTFGGEGWIGVVPFGMRRVRARFTPPLPGIGAFPELNVRTYVKHQGKPGVWFFSLDAASRLAVRMARRTFCLPYFDARMSLNRQDQTIHYRSLRTHRGVESCSFEARYRPTGAVYHTVPGQLDDFLTNRLCLYSINRRGRLLRGDIHHPPWPLQPAEAQIQINTMTQALGVVLPDTPPLLHFARQLDVIAWAVTAY